MSEVKSAATRPQRRPTNNVRVSEAPEAAAVGHIADGPCPACDALTEQVRQAARDLVEAVFDLVEHKRGGPSRASVFLRRTIVAAARHDAVSRARDLLAAVKTGNPLAILGAAERFASVR